MSSASNGGDGAAAERVRVLLYTPEDDDVLSELVCFLRAQLEVFAATPDDVASRCTRGGVTVGRVGFRCIHCLGIPPAERAKGSVSYPNSMRILNQAVRNWQRYHFLACECIPERLKEKYRSIKGKRVHSSKTSMEYWTECCERMEMVDTDDGIRFKSDLGGARIIRSDDMQAVAPKKKSKSKDATRKSKNKQRATNSKEHVQNDDPPKQSASTPSGAAAAANMSQLDQLDQVDLEIDADMDSLSWMDMKMSADDEEFMAQEADTAISSSSGREGVPVTARADYPQTNSVSNLDRQGQDQVLDLDMGEIGEGNDELKKNGTVQVTGAGPIELWSSETVDGRSKKGNSSDGNNGGAVQLVTPHSSEGFNQLIDMGDNRALIVQQADSTDLLMQRVSLAHGTVKTTREMRHVPSGVAAVQGQPDSRRDLFALGVELYELFGDRHPFDGGAGTDMSTGGHESEDAPQRKRGKRRTDQRAYTPLIELGLPTSLSNLVSSLLDMGSDGSSFRRYESVDQVEEDLRQMIVDPKRYLLDIDVERLDGRLEFPFDRSYGQEANVLKLVQAYDRVVIPGQTCELVLISGISGTGKTMLVRQAQRHLVEKGGCFISGKFDQMRQVQPFSGIVDAFNEYCDIMLTRDAESLERARNAIKDAVGNDGKVLTALIPRLCEIIGQPEDSTETLGGKEAENRLEFFFRKFLRTISSPLHPCILFLDDLQWADDASLDLLGAFAMDSEIGSLLLLGCYRENEVGEEHPLTVQLGAIALSGANLTTIKIGNMEEKTVNELISDTLHLPPRLTEPLTSIVFHKTNGNGLFVVQFLKSLCDEGLLHFSLEARQWEWDLDGIKAKALADNVVELMASKMLKLPSGVQSGLKIAACLGAQCDESTLKFLSIDSNADYNGMLHLLDDAVNEGLMFKVGTSYAFAHDEIQSAAYALIPESEQKAMHLKIGRSLWKGASEEELDSILFVAVDQLYRGSDLIDDNNEKIDLVRLFLRAGDRAISASAFLPASIYLLQGIGLLGDDDWTNHYELSIELYSACAETYYVTGNRDGLTIVSNPVLERARSLHDKLRVYYTLVSSLAADGKLPDAIKFGLGVLEQLGESFPSDIDQGVIMGYIGETKGVLEGLMTDSILEKNEMQDRDKIASMQFLNVVCFHSFFGQPQLFPVIVSRMVQLSLSHGVTKESTFAFGAFGSMLCNFIDDAPQGYVLGKIAISLVNRFDAKEHTARVWLVVYGLVNIFFEPIQACIESVKFAVEVGMSTGDIQWASANAFTYALASLQCGRELEPCAQEMRSYSQQMKEYKQRVFRAALMVYEQAALNLMASSRDDDPTDLAGEATEHKDILVELIETQNWNGVSHFYFVRMWLAYIFRRYDLACEMAAKRRRTATNQRGATIVNETFYAALIALASANEGGQHESRSIAHDAREKMRAWAENCKWNFLHKLELLNAEIAFVDGDLETAAKSYQDAIYWAGEHGFINEQALACERAGIFFSKAANSQVANEHFSRAHQLYLQWGATRKALDLLEYTESGG